jgi:hypothetical protein
MSEPRKPLLIFTPWRYSRAWARFMGWTALFFLVINLTMLFTGVKSGLIWYPATGLLLAVIVIDQIKNYLDHRKFKRTMKTLKLMHQVIGGNRRLEDLTPAEQEEIAIQRAATYTKRDHG